MQNTNLIIKQNEEILETKQTQHTNKKKKNSLHCLQPKMTSKYKISMHKFRTKHNKLEQKDPTSIINITYNLQICYLFNNESIFLGFSILGFIWFLPTKSEIRTDLT